MGFGQRLERIEHKQDTLTQNHGGLENPHNAKKYEKLQNRQERVAKKQIKNGKIATEDFEAIDKNDEIRAGLENIQNQVIDSKLNIAKNNMEIQNLLTEIDKVQAEIPFIKSGESAEEQAILNKYNALLSSAEQVLGKNNAYTNKLRSGKFTEDLRNPADMQALLIQVKTLLENAKNTASQVQTGQYKGEVDTGAHNNSSNGNAAKENHNTSYESFGEALTKGGIKGALDKVGQLSNLSPGYRGFASGMFVLGALGLGIFGIKKLNDKTGSWWKTAAILLGSDMALRMTTGYATGKSAGLLELTKGLFFGGKTHEFFVNKLLETGNGSESENEGTEEKQTVLDKLKPSLLLSGFLRDIPFEDYTKPCIIDGKERTLLSIKDNKINGLDIEVLQKFIDNNPNLSKEDKKRREDYIQNYNSKTPQEQQKIQQMFVQGFTDLGISHEDIQNHPDRSITGYYKDRLDKLAQEAEQEKKKEEQKQPAQQEKIDYDGRDAANIKPQLTQIETQLDQSQKAAFNKQQLEEKLNTLYQQHPKARPITLGYENGMLKLTTYGNSCKVDIFHGEVSIYSNYNSTPRKASHIQEGIDIANLTNLSITNYSGVSDFDGPFNLSLDGTEQDIEFSKTGGRTSGLSGLDLTILEDTWFNNFDQQFPSINNNKKGFVEWMNNFKSSNESLWNKNSVAYKEIRTLEEKLKSDYGIQETTDIEKNNRKLSGLLKGLGWEYEGMTNQEYKNALIMMDTTLKKFPSGMLKKFPVSSIVLGKNFDTNPYNPGKAKGTTFSNTEEDLGRSGRRSGGRYSGRRYGGPYYGHHHYNTKPTGSSMSIDTTSVLGIGEVLAHEYMHHLTHMNSENFDKRKKIGGNFDQTDNNSLSYEGFMTPYSTTGPKEDNAEIGSILLFGGGLSNGRQQGIDQLGSGWPKTNLFERIKTDPILLKKVEVFTGCKLDPNSPAPFIRPLSSEEWKGYGFDEPAFFSKRAKESGTTIDHTYWNNLKNNVTV